MKKEKSKRAKSFPATRKGVRLSLNITRRDHDRIVDVAMELDEPVATIARKCMLSGLEIKEAENAGR